MDKDNKKAFAIAGVGLGALALFLGFSPNTMTAEEIVAVEAHAQEIFGGSAKEVGQMLFNERLPAKVKLRGKDWEFTGTKFKTVLKEKAVDGLEYIENGKSLILKSEGMAWDGSKSKLKAESVVGETKKGQVKYKGALGEGIDIKVIQGNYRLQKIIEIESLESLGVIPDGAEYLEFSFKISGDFDLPEGVIGERIPFGENSFLQPVRAWDSSEEDSILLSGAFGEITGKVITKKIPVTWLQSATYPVSTDATITFGSAATFESARSTQISTALLDSTQVVIAYADRGNSSHGTAAVCAFSGTTISSCGTPNIFAATGMLAIKVVALDSTHFFVGYADFSTTGEGIIGVTSGTTISSYGSAVQYNAAFTNDVTVALLDSTHAVVCYKDDGGDNFGHCRVAVTSGTTISSFGAENTFKAEVVGEVSAAALDSTHFAVAFNDASDSNGYARVGVTSGTTISSYGSEVQFTTGAFAALNAGAIDSTHFALAYRDNGNSLRGTATVAVTSGTTISSFGTESVFNATGNTVGIGITGLTDSVLAVSYKDDDASDFGTAIIGDISGTTISGWGDENVFNSAVTPETAIVKISETSFAVAFDNASTSGDVIIGSIPEPVLGNAIFLGTGF